LGANNDSRISTNRSQGLHQYRATCQAANIQSLEQVIRNGVSVVAAWMMAFPVVDFYKKWWKFMLIPNSFISYQGAQTFVSLI